MLAFRDRDGGVRIRFFFFFKCRSSIRFRIRESGVF